MPFSAIRQRLFNTGVAAADAFKETKRQIDKWGVQHHPGFSVKMRNPDERCRAYGIPTEDEAKANCQSRMNGKGDSWAAILIEEVSEAISTQGPRDRRKELIQVAAVCLSWVADIDEYAVDPHTWIMDSFDD